MAKIPVEFHYEVKSDESLGMEVVNLYMTLNTKGTLDHQDQILIVPVPSEFRMTRWEFVVEKAALDILTKYSKLFNDDVKSGELAAILRKELSRNLAEATKNGQHPFQAYIDKPKKKKKKKNNSSNDVSKPHIDNSELLLKMSQARAVIESETETVHQEPVQYTPNPQPTQQPAQQAPQKQGEDADEGGNVYIEDVPLDDKGRVKSVQVYRPSPKAVKKLHKLHEAPKTNTGGALPTRKGSRDGNGTVNRTGGFNPRNL